MATYNIGICGISNSGKNTFIKTILKKDISIEKSEYIKYFITVNNNGTKLSINKYPSFFNDEKIQLFKNSIIIMDVIVYIVPVYYNIKKCTLKRNIDCLEMIMKEVLKHQKQNKYIKLLVIYNVECSEGCDYTEDTINEYRCILSNYEADESVQRINVESYTLNLVNMLLYTVIKSDFIEFTLHSIKKYIDIFITNKHNYKIYDIDILDKNTIDGNVKLTKCEINMLSFINTIDKVEHTKLWSLKFKNKLSEDYKMEKKIYYLSSYNIIFYKSIIEEVKTIKNFIHYKKYDIETFNSIVYWHVLNSRLNLLKNIKLEKKTDDNNDYNKYTLIIKLIDDIFYIIETFELFKTKKKYIIDFLDEVMNKTWDDFSNTKNNSCIVSLMFILYNYMVIEDYFIENYLTMFYYKFKPLLFNHDFYIPKDINSVIILNIYHNYGAYTNNIKCMLIDILNNNIYNINDLLILKLLDSKNFR